MRLLTLLLCAALIGHPAASLAAGEGPKPVDYEVRLGENGQFDVRVNPGRESWTLALGQPPRSWQVSPLGHFLAFENSAGTDCLVDLATRKQSCSPNLELEPDEPRWSPAGTWLVWKSRDLTEIYLARMDTAFIVEQGSLTEPEISVPGHPLGLIWQESWLDEDLLLLGTGLGELFCYAALQPTSAKLFPLFCCPSPSITEEKCQEITKDPVEWLEASGLLSERGKWTPSTSTGFPW